MFPPGTPSPPEVPTFQSVSAGDYISSTFMIEFCVSQSTAGAMSGESIMHRKARQASLVV